VLKKAGIVVATAAAGLLAVSPLAFAGDKDDRDRDHDHDGKKKIKIEDVNHYDDSFKGRGLINVTDNNVAVNNCTQSVSDDDTLDLVDDATGVLTLLSVVKTEESNVQVCDQEADIDESVEQRIDD
jgi:hypothetical protein